MGFEYTSGGVQCRMGINREGMYGYANYSCEVCEVEQFLCETVL